MSSTTQAVTIQACRHCGTGAPPDAHFCPHCEKILTLARHGDYFSFLGLPRKLGIDPRELDERLRAFSRRFHPDFFCNATPVERLASLERSSYLNDAYRVLKSPVMRVEYLVQLEQGRGQAAPGRTARDAKPDAGFLEDVFAANEEIEAARAFRESGVPSEEARRRLEAVRQPIDQRQRAHDDRLRTLAAEWDALVDTGASADRRQPTLGALKVWLVEQTYLANLLAAVDRDLDLV